MSGKINIFWLIVAIVFTAVAIGLCGYAALRGSVYIRPEGDPQETVVRFFDELEAENYEQAYACLSDYATLGLENEAGTAESGRILQALKDSYDYSLQGECERDQLSAAQTVRFRYLDVRRVENEIAARVDGILEELVASRPRNEIYDANDKYLPAVTEEVYTTALDQVLETAEQYYMNTELEINLDYLNDQWLMRTSPALIQAILGGAA